MAHVTKQMVNTTHTHTHTEQERDSRQTALVFFFEGEVSCLYKVARMSSECLFTVTCSYQLLTCCYHLRPLSFCGGIVFLLEEVLIETPTLARHHRGHLCELFYNRRSW